MDLTSDITCVPRIHEPILRQHIPRYENPTNVYSVLKRCHNPSGYDNSDNSSQRYLTSQNSTTDSSQHVILLPECLTTYIPASGRPPDPPDTCPHNDVSLI